MQIRGVDEAFSDYGYSDLNEENQLKIIQCKKLFYEPIVLEETGVVLSASKKNSP